MSTPVRRLAAALTAATLLSACSGSQDTPEPEAESSAGAQSAPMTMVGPVELRLPDGWEEQPEVAAEGQEAFGPPATEGQRATQGLTVSVDAAAGDVQIAAQLHAAGTQGVFFGIKPGPRRNVEVPGAAGAVRQDWFLAPGGEDTPGGSFYDLVVVTDDGQEVVVRLATSDPQQDEALADRVLGSVRVAS